MNARPRPRFESCALAALRNIVERILMTLNKVRLRKFEDRL